MPPTGQHTDSRADQIEAAARGALLVLTTTDTALKGAMLFDTWSRLRMAAIDQLVNALALERADND